MMGFVEVSSAPQSVTSNSSTGYCPGDSDVCFDVKYCGMCHTDVRLVKDELGNLQYPLFPGRELIGVVTAVGSSVTKFAVGDDVGVGCVLGSCLVCSSCKKGFEEYCSAGRTGTYEGVARPARCGTKGLPTTGDCNTMVVNEHLAVSIPKDIDLVACAPLVCAGITICEPLCEHGCKAGFLRVGIAAAGSQDITMDTIGTNHKFVPFMNLPTEHPWQACANEARFAGFPCNPQEPLCIPDPRPALHTLRFRL